MKIAVMGGVRSTSVVIQKLRQHGFEDVFVFGYVPDNTLLVSGWFDLSAQAMEAGYAYMPFKKVSECTDLLQKFSPDRVFAVGLSQIIPESMLRIPANGFVGFHPTKLPLGRGRAPLAWLILEQNDGAATFFVMQQGVDDGDILVQESFSLESDDDASSIEDKLLTAESVALDYLLPRLADGSIQATPQDHNSATYYGKRSPQDGWINWNNKVEFLLTHIRASCPPHPGAFTFDGDTKIVILRADISRHRSLRGVVGRILEVADNGEFTIQCGDDCLSILDWTSSPGWVPKVGRMLGYYSESEIYVLRSQVASLQSRVDELDAKVLELLSERDRNFIKSNEYD